MAERKVNVFKNFGSSPMRDHSENPTIIEQGIDAKALERIEKAERGELKAKLAAILDRGVVQDRLVVENVPDDLHYEWVRNDPLEIRRLEALGFKVDTEYAAKRSIHSDGSDSSIVGDVICMICPKEVHDVINEIRVEQVVRQHTGKRVGQSNVNREEREYLSTTDVNDQKHVVAYSGSSEKTITKDDLVATLNEIDKQTKPSTK